MPDDGAELSTSKKPSLEIDSINASSIEGVSDQPDEETELEKKSLEVEHLKASLKGLTQDIEERKKYAHRIFCLICVWLTLVLALLICEGFGQWTRFYLPEAVILAAIGSTTLNVLGIFYLVAHYLFPKKNS